MHVRIRGMSYEKGRAILTGSTQGVSLIAAGQRGRQRPLVLQLELQEICVRQEQLQNTNSLTAESLFLRTRATSGAPTYDLS